jgi:prophage regulatory protein
LKGFSVNNTKLSETGFLRLSDVLTLIPVGKTTWWVGVKTGRFPKPLKLGTRITVWKTEDIIDFIQDVGRDDGQEIESVLKHEACDEAI